MFEDIAFKVMTRQQLKQEQKLKAEVEGTATGAAKNNKNVKLNDASAANGQPNGQKAQKKSKKCC